MAENNATILSTVWLNGTNDFQQRVPNPTIAGIDATMKALFDPMNNDLWNQFVDTLVKRIGMVKVHNKSFRNPLGEFVSEDMFYGSTIQEIAPKWIKAHAYSFDSTLLDVHRPGVSEWFHSINRRDVYPISLQETELRQSFTSEYGLNQLVTGFLQAPMNADAYDEMRIMIELMSYYDKHWGFFKHNLTADPLTEAGGKEFLKLVQSYAGKLKFPTTLYNASVIDDIPVFIANPSELMLVVTPDLVASLNVDVLASLFHVELADLDTRRIIIDQFPIEGAFALLTTRDWFVCHNTVKQLNSFYDGSNMCTNYWYHRQGIYSASPFVPAILFTYGGESTTVPTVTQTVTGLNLVASTNVAQNGDRVQLTPTLVGSLAGATAPQRQKFEVEPDAVTYSVTATADLANTTYVDREGVLHIQKRPLPDGTVITVTATSSYINPSGATNTYTASVDVTVTNGQ